MSSTHSSLAGSSATIGGDSNLDSNTAGLSETSAVVTGRVNNGEEIVGAQVKGLKSGGSTKAGVVRFPS